MSRITTFIVDEEGTTAVEYAVMLALIIGLCLGAISQLGAGSTGMWGNNLNNLQSNGF